MQGVCARLCCAARRCKCVHKCIQKKSPSVTVSPSQPNIIIVIFIISLELVLPQIVKGPTQSKKLHNNCYRPCETFAITTHQTFSKHLIFFSVIGCLIDPSCFNHIQCYKTCAGMFLGRILSLRASLVQAGQQSGAHEISAWLKPPLSSCKVLLMNTRY